MHHDARVGTLSITLTCIITLILNSVKVLYITVNLFSIIAMSYSSVIKIGTFVLL